MRFRITCAGFLVFLCVLGGMAKEQKPLTPDQKKFADSLAAVFRLDICGSKTIDQACANPDACPIAPRLRAFTEWLCTIAPDHAKVRDELAKRYANLTSSDTVRIQPSDMAVAGEKTAPVQVVMYVSANCPLCRYVSKEVYAAVTSGELKGKARVTAKPFTLGVGDVALMAANRNGKFWEYLCALAAYKARFNDSLLVKIADSLRIDAVAFRKGFQDPAFFEELTHFRGEGDRLGVTVTPTVFIDGRRYESYKDPQWVVDAIAYRYEVVELAKKKR